jgi:branched-chain amino acid aminotransferase
MEIRNLAKVSQPSNETSVEDLGFGKHFCPNYFIADYIEGRWQNPRIELLENFKIHPGATIFHYAQGIIEGLKAFRHKDNSIHLFRPEKNCKRFNYSAERMHMPTIDEDFTLEAVVELVRNERYFVPPKPGSLYLRPTMIGSEPLVIVSASHEYMFFVLALPTGGYFKGMTNKPGVVRVLISRGQARAIPGGTGSAKASCNYAPTLRLIAEAKEKDCHQIMFLDARTGSLVEEMGGMNVMFVCKDTLLTPRLTGTILEGITRESIMFLAKEELGIETIERDIDIEELKDDIKEKKVTEAIACGTGAVITSIGSFLDNGDTITVGDGEAGPITCKLYNMYLKIQYGETEDKYGWNHKVCDL